MAASIDLEEAFSPTDYPLGLTARTMRHVWFRAAVACARRRSWRYAAEALLKAQLRFPPVTWSSGTRVVEGGER